jgi:hypothetical protein
VNVVVSRHVMDTCLLVVKYVASWLTFICGTRNWRSAVSLCNLRPELCLDNVQAPTGYLPAPLLPSRVVEIVPQMTPLSEPTVTVLAEFVKRLGEVVEAVAVTDCTE